MIDGPNLKAPVFSQLVYDVGVSEGASIGAEVITLEARDPEGKAVIYDIVAGNELHHFTIGKNTGILSVNGQLDREDLSRYSLVRTKCFLVHFKLRWKAGRKIYRKWCFIYRRI